MQSRRAVRYRIAAPSRHLVWASAEQGASATARLSRSHSSKVRCQFHTKCKEASSPVRRLASLRDRQSVALFEFQRGVEAAEAATENDYARLAGQTVIRCYPLWRERCNYHNSAQSIAAVIIAIRK